VIAVIGVAAALFFSYFFFIRKPSLEKVLRNTAEALNKTCPSMADKDTRLDNAVALPDNVFQYNYTLVNLLKDSMDVEMFMLSVEPAMISNARANPDLQLFRDNKITLSYHFKDMAGNFVTRIKITPEKYTP
jgi:hypothetical protein